jgi:hypothetical protein
MLKSPTILDYTSSGQRAVNRSTWRDRFLIVCIFVTFTAVISVLSYLALMLVVTNWSS